MKTVTALVHAIHVAFLLCVPIALTAAPGTSTVVRTNLAERWITNLIEIRMPVNRFINQYQTNWVEQVRTNLVDVFATNRLVCTLTNSVVVDLVRTNFVTSYQTNLKTLHLTNWTTVLVFRTNWVNQPITNVVQIDLARETENKTVSKTLAKSAGSSAVENARPATVTSPAAAGSLTALNMEAQEEGLKANGSVEVRLSVKWAQNANLPVQVQQWRVEKDDGSILCFGQDREFTRALPAGKYKVEVKAQRHDGSLLTALGTLVVMPREVVLQQQKMVAKN